MRKPAYPVAAMIAALFPFSVAVAQDLPALLPMEVGVITLAAEDVPYVLAVPGRAVAYEQVAIRPRVEGVVTEILYHAGQPLKVGDPLFRLDDASYAATVAADEAALAEAEAALPLKQEALERTTKLRGTGYTQSDLETAQADLASAEAAVQSAQAALKYARTQLSWTTITSPIEGIAEVAAVSVGDLVTAGQSDALTTITRLDPIDVDLMQASSQLLSIRQQIEDGSIRPGEDLQAQLVLENGEVFTGTGTLFAPSAQISTTTGSQSIRFRFDNPDHRILPGMFLRGQVTLGTIHAFLVPQRAGEMLADGSFTVYLAGEDGKAHLRKLKPMDSYGNAWIVREGLQDGERLILDGQKSLSDQAQIVAVPASLDENGLVVKTDGK